MQDDKKINHGNSMRSIWRVNNNDHLTEQWVPTMTSTKTTTSSYKLHCHSSHHMQTWILFHMLIIGQHSTSIHPSFFIILSTTSSTMLHLCTLIAFQLVNEHQHELLQQYNLVIGRLHDDNPFLCFILANQLHSSPASLDELVSSNTPG